LNYIDPVKKLSAPIALLLASVALFAQAERFVGPSSQTLYQLFIEYWEWRLAQQPELATRFGRVDHNDRWRDWSKSARERLRRDREEFLQKALYLEPGNLNAADRLSARLMISELQTQLEVEPYADLVQRTSQSDGVHNEVFNIIDQMPSRTVRDYENIVTRLRNLPALVDQTISLMQEQLAAGLAQPAIVVDLTLDQIVAQRSAAPDDSPLLVAFRRFPGEIGAADQQRLRTAARSAYVQSFVPSWTKLETFLRGTYRSQARREVGLGSLKDGQAAYAALIHAYTTTRLAPERIHQVGLDEVARIEKEMERLARAAGFTGPVTDYERQLGSQPGMRFSSQEEMLQTARDALARVQPAMSKLFSRVPKMTVGIRPIPPDREASTASNYTVGNPDGSRPAWFNMNTYRPHEQFRYSVESLVLHEALPGHHLQVGLARELPGLPEFRRAYAASAFSEGWALYGESLGSELGVYRDPASRFGQLASEQFRAVRLVVDSGIHAMGWSRERAREYFARHVPAQSIAEVDRYIARPGQALAYKLGQLKILELRRKAEQTLGPKFDIRVFHDAVLRNGTLPLDLLEDEITAYLAAAAQRPGRS
jgi:uncharacterized protein (DUF885 family)